MVETPEWLMDTDHTTVSVIIPVIWLPMHAAYCLLQKCTRQDLPANVTSCTTACAGFE